MNLFFPSRIEESLGGVNQGTRVAREQIGVSGIPAQGFRLRIEPSEVHLEAADARGLFYGRQTLDQILKLYPNDPIPCCRIEDWPDFKDRGYMLDISRDRVPTMEHLFHLVDALAKLRYNQLQLYTEHTFAYEKHPLVWANASPITAAEIRELDAYCRERFIELVPNQNSFGHMERWLEHDAYKHLAECPEGFRHPISGAWHPQGSVIKPDQQSLEFLDGLYSELLPNFSSRKFNVGGDEPWELGWGVSREKVEAEGKHKVYADFLAKVCQLAEQHGSEPMCWADVLMEEPAAIQQLPGTVRPIIWGYELDHPFDKQCGQLAQLGREFYVAPGDSTWNSYTGRYSTMVSNVRAAAQIGHRRGASGLLMTHWGDGGHPQAWPVSLPGMVWAGLCGWNVGTQEAQLVIGLKSLLNDRNGIYTETLLDCGRIDEILGVSITNWSYLAKAIQLNEGEVAAFQPRPTKPSLREVIRTCEGGLDALAKTQLDCRDSGYLIEELELMLRLNIRAARYSLGRKEIFTHELRNLYERSWKSRSRDGGLADSLRKQHLVEGTNHE